MMSVRYAQIHIRLHKCSPPGFSSCAFISRRFVDDDCRTLVVRCEALRTVQVQFVGLFCADLQSGKPIVRNWFQWTLGGRTYAFLMGLLSQQATRESFHRDPELSCSVLRGIFALGLCARRSQTHYKWCKLFAVRINVRDASQSTQTS